MRAAQRSVVRRTSSRVSTASAVLAVLLAGAGALALVRAVGGADLTRLAAAIVAVMLGWLAAGAFRSRPWALGAGFLLGLFWLWAAVALGLQRQLGPGQTVSWVAWSIAVILTSVRARVREPGDG